MRRGLLLLFFFLPSLQDTCLMAWIFDLDLAKIDELAGAQ